MTTTHKIILGIIGVLVAFFIGKAITNSPTHTAYTPETVSDLSLLREGFNDGCKIDPAFADYCNCAFDEIIENMGVEGFMKEASYSYRTDLYSDNFNYQIDIAADACFDKF